MAAARNMYLKDYGISYRDEERILNLCRNSGYEIQKTVLQASNQVYPEIAVPLFVNLTTGIGYDMISKRYHIPMQRKDFQGYRRKTLAVLKDLIKPD